MDHPDGGNRLFGLSKDALRELGLRTTGARGQSPKAGEPPELPGTASSSCPGGGFRLDQLQGYIDLQHSHAIAAQAGIELPYLRPRDGIPRDTSLVDGEVHLNFSSYNYLDLCGHPEVSQAAKDAIDRHGTSASASRVVSGERPIHRELERSLASALGAEDCIAFVGGHATNVTVIGHLFGRKDLILHDASIHNSVVLGALLSGADRRSFPHDDVEALDRILSSVRGRYERALIVTEGQFSMDGDVPSLSRLCEIKRRHRATLMVDEAHSIGILGPTGRGLCEHQGIDPKEVDICMGTLSKTLAGCGGFIAGPAPLIEYLKFTSPGFVYSVGIPPPMAAASLAALRIMLREPDRVRVLNERASLFLGLCRKAGLDTGLSMGHSIVPIIVGSSLKALTLSGRLRRRHIDVMPIVAPAVEERTARLRFFVSCSHSEDQIRTAVRAIADEMAGLA